MRKGIVQRKHELLTTKKNKKERDNDPSAGSPTETLLRLQLPLDVKVRSTFQPAISFLLANQSEGLTGTSNR